MKFSNELSEQRKQNVNNMLNMYVFQEFTSPPGNHNKLHIFELNPPLRARYILLGVTEYDTNPCIRFDLSGCLAPLSLSQEVPLHLQVTNQSYLLLFLHILRFTHGSIWN